MCSRLEWTARLTQIILYFCAAVLGVIIAIPLAIVKGKFKGHCLLYASGKWTKTAPDAVQFQVDKYSASSCNFILGVAAVLCTVVGLLVGLVLVYRVCRYGKETRFGACCSAIFPVTNAICAGFVLVAALMFTVGLQHFCNSLLPEPNHINSCRAAQADINWEEEHGTIRFYDYLTFSKMAAWVCCLALILQTVCSIFLSTRAGCCKRNQDQGETTNLPKAEVAPAGSQKVV